MIDDLGRVLTFAILLTGLGLLETLDPWRPARQRVVRWVRHLALQVLAVLLTRVTVPVSAMTAAALADAQGWGLLPWLAMAPAMTVVVALVLMDLGIYAQHVMMHRWPVLWRLHRLHHSDRILDVTTALRFHPLEMLLSMVWKIALVLALGVPASAVLVFELILSSAALFNHANIRLPAGLDRCLRLLLVTPDMHRVHHSRIMAETDSNFGFFLPWWDRLFGTYVPVSRQGNDLAIGLNRFGEARDNTLPGMLVQPFRGQGA